MRTLQGGVRANEDPVGKNRRGTLQSAAMSFFGQRGLLVSDQPTIPSTPSGACAPDAEAAICKL